MKVASGLAHGRSPDAALAARAVEMAMQRAGVTHAESVLLYLTADFAHDPHPALAAAARAAGCLQISGCAAPGVFTDEDWVIDAPAAAALVLAEGVNLHPAHAGAHLRLTLAAPNALDLHWLESGGPRFGGVSGDATGQGPFAIWMNARLQTAGRCELDLRGAALRIGLSRGVRILSEPAPVRRRGNDILSVGALPALSSLSRELPLSLRASAHVPVPLLMAGLPYGDPVNALTEGRFHLLPLVGVNAQDKSVTIAGEVAADANLFWAMRLPQAAENDMQAMLARLIAANDAAPAFGLMFPCMGRGPWLYGGEDRDIAVLKRRFPGMPFIGFYGNGEIAHFDGANRLLQYSAVLALGQAPA